LQTVIKYANPAQIPGSVAVRAAWIVQEQSPTRNLISSSGPESERSAVPTEKTRVEVEVEVGVGVPDGHMTMPTEREKKRNRNGNAKS
jgi:hypothetical protein